MNTSSNEFLSFVARDLVKQLLGLLGGCDYVSRPLSL